MAASPDFRRLALSMPDAVEGSHMDHADFRANGRIFASLHPDGLRAMVRLTPDQQRALVDAHADCFTPANGAWGRQGCTYVLLERVAPALLRRAIADAWQRTVEEQPTRRRRPQKSRRPPR